MDDRIKNELRRAFDYLLINEGLGPKKIHEDYVVSRLIWCLNSGGKRDYYIKCRPDTHIRNSPQPEFVLAERLGRGQKMAVEIKRIFYPRTRNRQAHERRIRTALMQCLHLIGYSMPKYGVFSVDILDSTTKEDWKEAVLCMSERILEAVPTMVQGEFKTFDSPLEVRLTKNVNCLVFDHLGGT
jgi:hypothetical protein